SGARPAAPRSCRARLRRSAADGQAAVIFLAGPLYCQLAVADPSFNDIGQGAWHAVAGPRGTDTTPLPDAGRGPPEALWGSAGLQGLQEFLVGPAGQQLLRWALGSLLERGDRLGSCRLLRAKFKPGRKLSTYYDAEIRGGDAHRAAG